MPLLRLTKTDPTNAVVDVTADMTLAYTGFSDGAYHFDWTLRAGLLPLSAIAKTVSPNARIGMLRSVWILCDGDTSGFWDVGDTVTALSSRLGSRLAIPPPLTQAPIKLGVIGPFDRIAFLIGAKGAGKVYSIDILINTLDEGDVSYPETPVTP